MSSQSSLVYAKSVFPKLPVQSVSKPFVNTTESKCPLASFHKFNCFDFNKIVPIVLDCLNSELNCYVFNYKVPLVLDCIGNESTSSTCKQHLLNKNAFCSNSKPVSIFQLPDNIRDNTQMHGVNTDSSYVLTRTSALVSQVSCSNENILMTWHKRLRHPHVEIFQKTMNQIPSNSLPKSKYFSSISFCDDFQLGKMHKNHFPTSHFRATEPLALIHSDV